MRYLLFLTLLIFSLHAQETQKKQKVTIGFGPYVQSQPYKNLDPFIVPSPVIFFDNEIFYVRWTRVGIYFLGNKGDDISWAFSLTIRPRIYGYKAEGSQYLQGMDDRDTTFEGGLAFSAIYNKTYIEATLLTDILVRYESWLFTTEIGDEFKLGSLTFYPSLSVAYQSDDFVNYYYGVRAHEATQTRVEFIPGGGWQMAAQTFVEYPLTDKLSALINFRAESLPTSALDSPIVNDSFIYSGIVSLIYTFEY